MPRKPDTRKNRDRGPAVVVRLREARVDVDVLARGDVAHRVIATGLRRYYRALGSILLPAVDSATVEHLYRLARQVDPGSDPDEYLPLFSKLLPSLSPMELVAVLDAIERAMRLEALGIAYSRDDAIRMAGFGSAAGIAPKGSPGPVKV